jgi:hypothetical protein
MSKPVNSIRNNTAAKPKPKWKSGSFSRSMASSVRVVLDGTFLTRNNFSEWVSFVIFLAFLGLVYIGNNHLAEKKIRETDKINMRIKELKFDYMFRKSQLTEVTRQSFVGKQLEPTGIKSSINPPEKIFLNPKKPQP